MFSPTIYLKQFDKDQSQPFAEVQSKEKTNEESKTEEKSESKEEKKETNKAEERKGEEGNGDNLEELVAY